MKSREFQEKQNPKRVLVADMERRSSGESKEQFIERALRQRKALEKLREAPDF